MSLGKCVFTKSIDWNVLRLLAPPRDTLRSRHYATLKSARQPRRFIWNPPPQTQRLAEPDPKQQSGDRAVAHMIHGEISTTEYVSREELHSLQQSYGPAKVVPPVVPSANIIHDLDYRDNLNMAKYSKGDKTIARRIASKTKSQKNKIHKALTLKAITLKRTRVIDEKLIEIQWRRSIGLLIAHTEIKEDEIRRDTLYNGYEDQGGRMRYRFTQIPAPQVPRPCTWSTENFKDYVVALIESSVTGPLHQQSYNTGDSHRRSVTRILHQLFDDPQWNAYMSISACNMALSFFYKVSQFSKARSVLSLMEDRGLLTSSESFNIVLRGSAHLKDVGNFEYVLKQMIERGIKPNAETWMIFYRTSDSDQARSEIYHCMRDKGFLQDPLVIRAFLKLTIRDVLVRQFEKGRSITSLLEFFDGHDKRLWRSPDIANVILDEVGKRSPMRDVIKVLKQLEKMGMRFDEVTMNTMLHHCLPNKDHDDAIEIIHFFREKCKLLPRKVAYDALFRQAWYSQFYNCSKVIWRYACLEGFVTFSMKRSVVKSLLRDLPDETDEQSMTRGDMWRVAAGKLVVGLSLDVRSHAAFHRSSSPTSLLEGKEPTTPARSDHEGNVQNRWVECFLHDVALANRFHVHENLDDLLRRALALDRQWALEAVSTQKSLKWMLQHSIRVELRKNLAARVPDLIGPERTLKRHLEEENPLNFQGSEESEKDYYKGRELHQASGTHENKGVRKPSHEFSNPRLHLQYA